MSQNDDLISRQAAIEAMEDVDWYHIGKDGQLVHGANSKEDEPLYKAEDVYKVLEQLPSAQPDNDRIWEALSKVYNMDGVPDEAKSIIGDVMLGLDEPSAQPEIIRCKDCKYRDKFKYCTYKTRLAWIAPDNDFCSKAERRTDGM